MVDYAGYMLGKMMASISDVIDPEGFVIGGGVSQAGEIVIEKARESFMKNVFHASRDAKMALAKLGNDAGIYGGYVLAADSDII